MSATNECQAIHKALVRHHDWLMSPGDELNIPPDLKGPYNILEEFVKSPNGQVTYMKSMTILSEFCNLIEFLQEAKENIFLLDADHVINPDYRLLEVVGHEDLGQQNDETSDEPQKLQTLELILALMLAWEKGARQIWRSRVVGQLDPQLI